MPDTVLTADAVDFLTELERTFGPRRRELLAARHERAQRLLDGELPDFLPETKESATPTGASRRSRPSCRTVASRSPARSTGRW